MREEERGEGKRVEDDDPPLSFSFSLPLLSSPSPSVSFLSFLSFYLLLSPPLPPPPPPPPPPSSSSPLLLFEASTGRSASVHERWRWCAEKPKNLRMSLSETNNANLKDLIAVLRRKRGRREEWGQGGSFAGRDRFRGNSKQIGRKLSFEVSLERRGRGAHCGGAARRRGRRRRAGPGPRPGAPAWPQAAQKQRDQSHAST